MITLESTDNHHLMVSMTTFDLIRLQTGLAYAMSDIEHELAECTGIHPARRNFWSGELAKVEADFGRLQAILDTYNEGL